MMAVRPHNGCNLGVVRPTILALTRVLMLTFSAVFAAPLSSRAVPGHENHEEPNTTDPSTWVLFAASAVLVLTGGAFAGLTIALMGQDGIYLQVVSKDPTEPQQKNAKRVFDLLNKGKHWVLVTLLLSNVIVNESLPVVLDRCLGGGVAAVVGSTVLIVIFGEILPQSVCVRYGLQIGGYMSQPVLILMYVMAPVAWPTAKLLDWILGEDHGTVYKKSGLKTLVTLHKSLGDTSERLNQDEVTIISAVLDLKAKPVAAVMTPMEDVFTLSEDAILDEKTMDRILTAGYSRIPIHQPGNPANFVGMLLVRILITYDPEDARRVSDFTLATLPETRPETSCLDILNFFQEGKSHMVLVSEFPGDNHGALGVVTLEDVIEELIGEEIIDESDVYIDIHKAIRRLAPAPKARAYNRDGLDPRCFGSFAIEEGGYDKSHRRSGSLGAQSDAAAVGSPPKATTFMMRRSSAGADGRIVQITVPLRKNFNEIKEHLKHLGPSNPATNPKSTKYSAVKIKHALYPSRRTTIGDQSRSTVITPVAMTENVPNEDEADESAALLGGSALRGKDGAHAVRQSYGSVANASDAQNRLAKAFTPTVIVDDSSPKLSPQPPTYEHEDHATQTTVTGSPTHAYSTDSLASLPSQKSHQSQHSHRGRGRHHKSVGRHVVRSGSITENVVEAGGIRKMVLDVESDSDEEEEGENVTAGKNGDKSPRRHHSRANSLLSSIMGRGYQDGHSSDDEGEEDVDEHSDGGHEGDEGASEAGLGTPGNNSAVPSRKNRNSVGGRVSDGTKKNRGKKRKKRR